jgi:hypothetical protein
MKHTIYFLFLVAVLVCGCNSGSSYENSKENLYDKEKDAPLDFLSISGSDKRNFFGQTVVRATITNKASVCSYDDVRVKLLYYDKEGKQVANHEEELEKPVGPNSTVKFTAKYFTPKGTDSVAMSIMSAKALENTPATKK